VTLDQAKYYLSSLCGYSDSLLCADFPFGGDRAVPLVAFAHEPTDARTACIAVIDATTMDGDVRPHIASFRQLGAPIVVVLRRGSVEFWQQREGDAVLVDDVPANKAEAYFRKNAQDLRPEAVFRAKTWGRLDQQFQLSFVDAGLMPVVEQKMGQHLTDLVGRVYQKLRQSIWPKKDVSVEEGHWLIKASFWLLAAKILRDKRVKNFITLDFGQVEDVFARVARHYDSSRAGLAGIEVQNQQQRQALEVAAQDIADFSHLGHVTTESLSHVYESALITPQVRKALGTHSTPQYLVDYVVWKLRPWIEEIPEDRRHVFEPACGHAAFLVAAVRLLKELLQDKQVDQKKYLRRHLHGLEIDSFAIEIARLSLTLADIPNPNGWDLTCGDMFTQLLLEKKAGAATILLGNPPFENFKREDHDAYELQGWKISRDNKTAEVLGQILPQLPVGGVFGFVVPQGFLRSRHSRDVRSLICRDFEIQEICLFPDKVFSFSDAESAVILGRRVNSEASRCKVSYRRVRETDMPRFETDYTVSSRSDVPQASLCTDTSVNFCLPDLFEVWECLGHYQRLGKIANVGQSFQFKGRDLPPEAVTITAGQHKGVPGFAVFDARTIFGLPTEHRVEINQDVIRRPGTGVETDVPQVLVNYAPVSRGPWRLRAVIDREGHAVTSRFVTVRPKTDRMTLEFLWTILNSPVGNAFAFCHSDKRQTKVGTLREMPVPDVSDRQIASITSLAGKLLACASLQPRNDKRSADVRKEGRLLLSLDSEILRLYDLPPRLERQLLDCFAGYPREGVNASFERYYPENFEPWMPLHEYLSEEFQNSQAASLLQSHETFNQPEVSEALRRATEDFEEKS